MPKVLRISECLTGADFENTILNILVNLGFDAHLTGKEDRGIDIIASKTVDEKAYKFYIQCKFWNTTVGMKPIQEAFTGCHYFGNDGTPVVITNNRVTIEARQYPIAFAARIAAPQTILTALRYAGSQHIRLSSSVRPSSSALALGVLAMTTPIKVSEALMPIEYLCPCGAVQCRWFCLTKFSASFKVTGVTSIAAIMLSRSPSTNEKRGQPFAPW